MVPLAIPLEPLLAAMATYVLGEIGVDATKKMLKHGSIADEAGRAKAATATQSCPAKLDDDDPCKHLRNGNPNGKGKYRGGAHREMSKNKGDGLDSHHMPANQANKMGGGPSENDAPAIQMDPSDHRKTSSYGGGPDAAQYRAEQARLVQEGKLLDAAKRDVEDVKRVARRANDPGKYDEALKEAQAYLDCLQNEINRK